VPFVDKPLKSASEKMVGVLGGRSARRPLGVPYLKSLGLDDQLGPLCQIKLVRWHSPSFGRASLSSFSPRSPLKRSSFPAWCEATSFYGHITFLQATLERLVDFDRHQWPT